MTTLLVIDDEAPILHAFGRVFRAPEYTLVTAATGADGLDRVARDAPDVVVLDLNLSDGSGLEVFDRIRELDPRIPVVFITGHGTTETAIEAMKRGAFDYLLKPLELPQLRELVARASEVGRLGRAPATLSDEAAPDVSDAIVGRSPAMQEVYKAIGRVAPRDVTVLIRGESGTGKELVARALYQHSLRGSGPFLALNCAAIPEGLLESELFGHEKGAFTGAESRRMGKFEQADGGTLFLDEIGDLAPLAQAKVLRVIQEGQFERVGGNQTIRTDVRLIAATHHDLEALVREGTFRADLYYRLSVFTIALPPLRDRLDDLPLLVDHFLSRFRRELRKDVLRVTPEALDRLRRHDWPGNIRELQSVLKQAVLRSEGPLLLPDFLPPLAPSAPTPPAPPNLWDRFVEERLRAGTTDLHAEAQAAMEREVLGRVLRHTGGNQVQAAQILGITRGTLRAKIRALRLSIDRPGGAESEPRHGS
jgi:two-component system nitrogen regulation response regulator GlnG